MVNMSTWFLWSPSLSWNQEAPVPELEQISVHLLAYFECKPNTMPRKKETELLPVVREKGFSSLFPHNAHTLHCKNKNRTFQMAASSNRHSF